MIGNTFKYYWLCVEVDEYELPLDNGFKYIKIRRTE